MNPGSSRTERKKIWLLKEPSFTTSLLEDEDHSYGKMISTSPGNKNPRAIAKGSWQYLAGRLQSLAVLLPFSATFHYSWQSQGKHKQLSNFLAIEEFPLENSGMDSVHDPGLGAPWVQELRECHLQGAKLGVRDTAGRGKGATMPRLCLSWNPACAGIGSCWNSTSSARQCGMLCWAPSPAPPLPEPLPAPSGSQHWEFLFSFETGNSDILIITFAKPILQELELPAASDTKAKHSIAVFWEILSYSPLPPPTLQTHTVRLRRLDDFFFSLPQYKIQLPWNGRFYNKVPEMHLYIKRFQQ